LLGEKINSGNIKLPPVLVQFVDEGGNSRNTWSGKSSARNPNFLARRKKATSVRGGLVRLSKKENMSSRLRHVTTNNSSMILA